MVLSLMETVVPYGLREFGACTRRRPKDVGICSKDHDGNTLHLNVSSGVNVPVQVIQPNLLE